MLSTELPFESYMSKRILSFAGLFNVSLSFRAQSAKKACLRFAIFNFLEKLYIHLYIHLFFFNIFEIGLKNMERSYKNRSEEKYLKIKKIADTPLFFTS